MIGAIIIGERDFETYTGRRFASEWASCWLGWALAQLNPTLLEQKGLLHATENVASFLFEGCISRATSENIGMRRKHLMDNRHSTKWQKYMLPLPHWLLG